MDINAAPIAVFKQIYGGRGTVSNISGVEVPPPSKFGLQVLAKFDQPGYAVSALPDKKKLRGFRVTDADGNATDFYIDPSTAYISEYLFQYQRYNFGSTISKFREVDGVLIPTSFTQRFDMPAEAVLT